MPGGPPAPGRLRTEGSADAAPRGIGPSTLGRLGAMSLPGSPYVAYRGDDLHVEGRSLAALVRTYGTPLYVYSRSAMLDALASYQRALNGRQHLVCYAMK